MNYIKRIILLSPLFLVLAFQYAWTQPQLIATDAGNNIYPITFTDPAQKVIDIQFDEEITQLSTTTGWTITVGGVPQTIFGPILDPVDNTIIKFQLQDTIRYADRNDVYVTYNASSASPKIAGASGNVASFGPVQAFNNLKLSCEMWDLSRFVYKQVKTEVCAPINIIYTVTYYILNHYINSIHYNPAIIRLATYWNDGTGIENHYGPEISPGVFQYTFNHVFPDDPTVCYWDTWIAPGIAGIGYCSGGGLRKQFTYQNHSQDDEGDGIFEMQTDTIPVCLGQNFSEIFQDATYFNCNPQTEPDYANDGPRHIRFTYGTNFATGDRIQDILINGATIAFPYKTGVIKYDSIKIDGTPAPSGWASTDPISHLANLGTDEIGQIFEVTLENWGPCNPYNVFETNPPIITRSYIKIVDGPIAEAGPDQTVCYNDNVTMGGTILRAATSGTWITNSGDGSWTNQDSPAGAVYTPGPNDLVNNGVWLVLEASDGAGGCPDHRDSMYVTIRDELIVNGDVSGPDNVCQNETGLTYSVTDNPPVMTVGGATEYFWSVPAGWSITSGQGTREIEVDAGTNVGNQNVSVVLRYTTVPDCPSPAKTKTTTVNRIPAGTNQTFTVCENTTLNINPQDYTNVASSTFSWTGDNGSSGTGTINDSPTNATTSQITVIYTVTPTGPTGCVGNDFEIRVNVDPQTETGTLAYAAGQDEICLGNDVDLSVTGYVGSIQRYRWYLDGAWEGAANSSSDTRTTTPDDDGTWRYHVRVKSGVCPEQWGNTVDVIVNPTTVGGAVTPDRTVCRNSTSGTLTLAGHVGDVLEWEYRFQPPAGLYGAWTSIANTSDTYTSGPLNEGTYQFRAVVQSGECLVENSTAATITVNPTSVGGILTGGNDICNGGNPTALSLTGGSWTGNILRWEVNVDGGGWNTVSVGANSSYDPTTTTTPGDHVYRVSVQSGVCPESYSTTQTVNVNNALTVDASATETSGTPNDLTICFGESVDLLATIIDPGTGSGYSYNWSGNNGQNAVGANPTIIPNTTGTIRYTVTVTDDFSPTAGGNCEATAFVDIEVLANPTVNITPAGPSGICLNTDLNLDGNATPGDNAISTYTWSGDTEFLSATDVDDVNFNSNTPGSFNLDYTVTDTYGCEASDNVTVNVTGPVVNIADETAGVCEDNNLNLTAILDLSNAAGGGSGIWTGSHEGTPLTVDDVDDLLTNPASATPVFNTVGSPTLSSGSYEMIYTYIDGNTCSDADTITVEVSTVTASISSDPSVCAGTDLVIDGQPSGGTGVYPTNNWVKVTAGTWDLDPNPDPTTATLNVPAVTGSNVYTFYYEVADENGCSFTSPNYSVTVYEVPVADAGDEDFICIDISGAVDYTLNATPTVGTGTWTVSDSPTGSNLTFSDINNPNATIDVDTYGDYILRWTEVNGTICSDQDEVSLHFAEPAEAGTEQFICGSYTADIFDANNPSTGQGTWTITSRPTGASVTSWGPTQGVNDHDIQPTVDTYGDYTFTWTIQNGTGPNACSTSDDVQLHFAPAADAGNEQWICASTIVNLAANTTPTGTNYWTYTGPGTVTSWGAGKDSTDADASPTLSNYGDYTFTWTIINGPGNPDSCFTTDDVDIHFAEQADAGPEQFVCGTKTTTLAGNQPTTGVGTWTVSGPGTVVDWGGKTANDYDAVPTVSLYGDYTFTWTIEHGVGPERCFTTSTVDIHFAETASAGPEQFVCGNLTANQLSANTPSTGTTYWSYTGPGTLLNWGAGKNETDPDAIPEVSAYGDYVFTWTIVNGAGNADSCFTEDNVMLHFAEQAEAGPEQFICDSKTANVFAANNPSTGQGTWTFSGPSGSSIISWGPGKDANDFDIQPTVSDYGDYTFTWTIQNGSGPSACNTSDNVQVHFAEGADAGPNQDICGPLNFTLAANNPSTGSGRWTYSGPGSVTGWGAGKSENDFDADPIVDAYGIYTFTWTIVNGTGNPDSCYTQDDVEIRIAEEADAGDDQYLCDQLTVDLDANTPTVGNGKWTATSSDGVVTAWGTGDTNPDITATVNNPGSYTFRWTITNGSCSTFDEITVDFQPKATAGSDQHVTCDALTTTLGGNDPVVGRGTWTLTGTNPGTITGWDGSTDANDYNAQPIVSDYGTYTFRWTLENGALPAVECSSSDDVVITFYEQHTAATIADFEVCRDSSLAVINISGTFGGGASSASWSIVDGNGSLQNENTVGNTVTAEYVPTYQDINDGSVRFRLTTNPPGVDETCGSVSDDLIVDIYESVYVIIDDKPSIFIAAGTSANITATITGAGGTITTGTWSEQGALTGGTFTPSANNTNITFTPTLAQELAGGVTLRLTSDDPGTACGPVYDEIYVGIGENPVANALNDESLCQPADMKLTLVGQVSGSASSGSWSLPAVAGSGTRFEAPVIGPEDDNGTPADTTDDFRTVTQVYNIDTSDLAAPNNTATLTFRLNTNDPDGGGPVQPDWDEKDVSIISKPDTPPISGGGLAMMCAGTFGQYYEVPKVPGNTYTWNIPAGVTISNGGTDNWVVLGFPNPGNYTIEVQEFTPAPYNCNGDVQTLDIFVYDLPVAWAGDDTVICAGESVPLGGTSASGGNSGTGGSGTYAYSWSPSFGLDDASIEHPEASPSSTRTFTLTVTDLISGCAPETDEVTVTVNEITGGTINGDQVVCDGDNPGVISSSVDPIGSGSLSYDWEVSTDNINWVSLGENTLSYDPPVPAQTTYYKRIAFSDLGGKICSAESNVVEITFNSASAGTIGTDAIICSGDDPLLLTSLDDGSTAGVVSYQWQSSVDAVNFADIGAANFSTYDPPPQAVTTYYRRKILSTLDFVTCEDISNVVEIRVNELTPGTITNDQTVCLGGDPAVIGSADDGTTPGGVSSYSWESSVDGFNYSTIPGAINPTYDPPGGLMQTTYYRRIHTSDLGGVPCSATSNVITVTVNQVSPGSISADQTICSGDDPMPMNSVVLASGSGAVTYSWESSTDSMVWTPTGGTAANYDPSSLTETTYFRRVATSTLNTTGCDDISNVLTITVNEVDGGSIAGTQTVCEGEDPAALTSTTAGSGDGAITYQWQSSPDGVSFANIFGATAETYDPSALVQTTYYKRLTYSTLNAKVCIAESNMLTVYLNDSDPGSISGAQTVCNGGDPSAFTSVVPGSGPDQIDYRWESRTGTDPFAPIPGSNSELWDPAPVTLTTDYRRVTISTYNGVPCEQVSNVITVTVNDVDAGAIEAAQTICYGTAPAPLTSTADATGDGFITYSWEKSTDGTNYSAIPGATQNTYIPPILTQTTWYRRVATSSLNGNNCPEITAPVMITVNPLPVAELTGNNTICPGDSSPLTVTITTGTAPYEVTFNQGIGTVTYPASPGATDVTPATTTTYQLVSVEDANGCISDILSGNLSGSATITLRDTVEIQTQPHDAAVCENTDTSFTVMATGEGLLYQWEYTDDLATGFDPVDGTLAGHGNFDQATMNITSVNPMFDGYYYRVRVFSSFCSEVDYSDTVQLNIRYNPITARDPFDQLVCEGASTGFGVDAGITANPVFQWQISYDNGSSFIDLDDTAVYSGTTSDSLFIVSTATRFDGYQYRVVLSGDCGLQTGSAPAILNINERPEITDQPDDTTVCENNPVQFAVNPGVTTSPAYEWQVDMGSGFVTVGADTGIYTGSSSPTLSLSTAASVHDGYRYRVVVSGDCPTPVTSNLATLTVNEDPEITLQPRDTVICENESPFFSVNAGVTTAAAYQWQVSMDNGSSWLDLSDTAVYTGSATSMLRLLSVPSSYDQYEYRVIISGVCTPPITSNEVLLTVRERPEIIEQPADTTVCEDEPVSFSVNAGVTTGVLYEWQVDMGSGFLTIGADTGIYSGTSASELLLSAGPSSMNGYRYRVIVSGDCTPAVTSVAATLTIYEKAEITVQPLPKEICEESNTFFNISSGVTTSPAYEWQVNDGSGFITIGADTGIYSGTGSPTLLLNTVPSSYTGNTYRVIVSGVCPETATSDTVGLIVNDKPEIITQPANYTACENDPATFTVNAGVTTDVEYTWYLNSSGLWQEITLADQTSGEYAGVETATLTLNSATSPYNGYRYRVVTGGKCSPDVTSETVTLTVDERPEIMQQPMDRTICEDANVTFVVDPGVTTEPAFVWEYTANGIDWFTADMLPEVVTHTDDSLTLVAVPSTYNNYSFRVTVSGKCTAGVLSDVADLTVYEKPQIDIQPTDRDACEQDTVFFAVDAGVTTNATYTWQYYNGAAWVVPSAGIYQGVNDDTLFINGINSGLDGNQYRVVVNGFCSPSVISDTVELTVYERPEILVQPVASEICENESTFFGLNAGVTTNATYKWEYFDGANWQTASGSIFESGNTDTLRLDNVTSNWDGTAFRGIVYGECEPSDTTVEVILNVRIRPIIATQPVDEVTCENVSVSYTVDAGLTYSPVYQWQYHDGSSGWQNTIGANYSGANSATLTINNPVSSMNGFGYRVILTGYCGPQVISDSVSLTVDEDPEITLQPVNALICESSDTSFTINAGVTTDAEYKWYYDDGSGWAEVTADGVHTGFDTETLSLTNVPFSFDNNKYYVEVSGKCGTPVTSDRVSLFVLRRAEITQQPKDTASCELTNVSFTVETGQTDGLFIQWQLNDNSSGWQDLIDGGNYTGANMNELKVYSIDSIMDGYRYRALVYGTCPDSVISTEATLTVYDAPDVWNNPDDITVCEGDDAIFEIFATGDNMDYYWQVDMGDGFGFRTFTDTAGVYNGTATDQLTVIGPDRSYHNYRYRAFVEGSCNPVAYSNFAVLRINTGPEILDHPQSDTICEFGNVSFSVNAQGTNLEYIWQEHDGSGWNDLSDVGDYIGTDSPTMSIFNLSRTSSGNRYRVIINGDCPSAKVSDEAELIIKTSPVITAEPVDTIVCQDEPVEFSVAAEGSDLNYQWQLSTGGPFSNLGNDATYSGVNTPVLQISSAPTSFDNHKYRVVVSGTCAPSANSREATLRVNEFPTITVQPASRVICEGGNTSMTGGAFGPGLSYQWEYNDGSGWVPVPDDTVHSGVNTTSLSINNAPVSLNGYSYRLAVSSTCQEAYTAPAILTVNANPTANITGDGAFPFTCGGFDLNLDGNPAGGSENYTSHQWTGDITALSNNNQQQTVFNTLIDNTYDITYTVTDDNGCKGSDNVTIENNRPNAEFSSDAYPACGNLEVTFNNTSSGAASYEWFFDDGSPAETTENPVHGFDNLDPSGLVKYYNVRLVATSALGCSDTATQYITIYPKVDPTFEITPDTACQPAIATLVTQPGASNYEWDYGDGQQENGSYTMLHEYTNTSTEVKTYTVKLTTTSFYGCTESATEQITIYPLPTPNFTVSPIVQTFPDATVDIDNLVRTGPWEFEYNFGDGNTSTEEEPTHTYDQAGTYTIVQTVRAGECADSVGQSIVINPTAPLASFVMPESGCTPLQIQFENTSLYANSYIWDFGDGSISTKKDPIYTYFEGGTYAVTLTVSGPGGSDTYKQNIEIWNTPSIFFNNAPDSVYVGDKPVKFFNYSSDASHYSWNFGDYNEETGAESSTNTSDEFEPSHIYEFEGWKDVLLIGWNDHCRDTVLKEKAVYVSPAGSFIFPNVFRPNPNGPTGGEITNLSPDAVNSVFFPGVIDQVLEYHLYIYNRWGELIFQSDNVNIGWDGYINGRLAKQGVYVWKVKGTYTNGRNFVEVGDVTLLH